MKSTLDAFLHTESTPGVFLVLAAVLAMAVANSPLDPAVDGFFAKHLTLTFGQAGIDKPLLLWVNDGLMAVFFLLVGLEIKREAVEGELSRPSQIALPIVGALGGMIVPASIYAAVNWGDAYAMRGWAIPSATDIAFSIGVMAALGTRVPLGLKLFLVTLAIVDDLGAIVIIAVFYTSELSTFSLVAAGALIAVLIAMNAAGVRRVGPYLLVGVVLWFAVLKSGVHATLAGVILAFCIPLRGGEEKGDERPFMRLEHALKPWVAFFIVPVFAFANAGLSFEGMSFARLAEPVTFGIAAGLFVGKQIGVFGAAAAMIALGFARMPDGGTWLKLYGVSMIAGIGFTMSLFIGTLAFDDPAYAAPLRLGVLVGSFLSATIGFLILWFSPSPRRAAVPA